jgi:tRNA pseudouridine synthase 10
LSFAENVTLFKLDIKAQAGTYIKEFVHGDFGRTQPSLGHLLGGVHVDILALDVQVEHHDIF